MGYPDLPESDLCVWDAGGSGPAWPPSLSWFTIATAAFLWHNLPAWIFLCLPTPFSTYPLHRIASPSSTVSHTRAEVWDSSRAALQSYVNESYDRMLFLSRVVPCRPLRHSDETQHEGQEIQMGMHEMLEATCLTLIWIWLEHTPHILFLCHNIYLLPLILTTFFLCIILHYESKTNNILNKTHHVASLMKLHIHTTSIASSYRLTNLARLQQLCGTRSSRSDFQWSRIIGELDFPWSRILDRLEFPWPSRRPGN